MPRPTKLQISELTAELVQLNKTKKRHKQAYDNEVNTANSLCHTTITAADVAYKTVVADILLREQEIEAELETAEWTQV